MMMPFAQLMVCFTSLPAGNHRQYLLFCPCYLLLDITNWLKTFLFCFFRRSLYIGQQTWSLFARNRVCCRQLSFSRLIAKARGEFLAITITLHTILLERKAGVTKVIIEEYKLVHKPVRHSNGQGNANNFNPEIKFGNLHVKSVSH